MSRSPHRPRRSVWLAGHRRRRRAIISVLLFVAAALAVADRTGWLVVFRPARPAARDDFSRYHDRIFIVAKVVDGDTLDLDVRDANAHLTRVRLRGVDTPELHTGGDGPMHFGPEAAAFAREMVESKRVRIGLAEGFDTRGRYGRLLAYVTEVETGRSLNEALLITGHGYADPRFDHPQRDRYRRLEVAAKSGDVGLWREVTSEGYPHWKKRRSR